MAETRRVVLRDGSVREVLVTESAVKDGWRVPEDPAQPDVCVGCLNQDKVNEWNRMAEATR